MGAFTFNAPSTGTVASSSTALSITNSSSGDALTGSSQSGDGLEGSTSSGNVNAGVHGTAPGYSAGVWGENGTRPSDFWPDDPRWSTGVRGSNWATNGAPDEAMSGIYAESLTCWAMYATSQQGGGVYGECWGAAQPGVQGYSENGTGVYGNSVSSDGVVGTANGGGTGVAGNSTNGIGVRGETKSAQQAGVAGINTSGSTINGPGVYGQSTGYDGVHGETQSSQHAGVSGINTGGGFGVYGAGNPAGYFSGDVLVTGDVVLVNSSGDVAEDFDVEDGPAHGEPGTVLVINSNGKLRASLDAYDTRVAGVIAGAGELKPAIVLQRVESDRKRSPIALIGKAFCKVDASFGSINAGDLLTTSSTPGHAMKVLDYTKATGAILGKALKKLECGQGLIPILVTPH